MLTRADGDINPYLTLIPDSHPFFLVATPFAEPIRDPQITCEIDSDFDDDAVKDMDELIDGHNTWVEGALASSSAPDGYQVASGGDALIDEGMISDDEAVETVMALLREESGAEPAATSKRGRTMARNSSAATRSRKRRRVSNRREPPLGSHPEGSDSECCWCLVRIGKNLVFSMGFVDIWSTAVYPLFWNR